MVISEPSAQGPSGLSGWLILVGLGLVLSPLRLCTLMIPLFVSIFRDGTWEALTTPGSDLYHWFWAPLLILELVVNSAFVFSFVAVLVLFFRKSPLFPRLFVAVVLFNIGFIVVDAFLGSVVLAGPVFDPDTLSELVRAAIGAAIWVPYMIVSKRVKNTFVEPVQHQELPPLDAPHTAPDLLPRQREEPGPPAALSDTERPG